MFVFRVCLKLFNRLWLSVSSSSFSACVFTTLSFCYNSKNETKATITTTATTTTIIIMNCYLCTYKEKTSRYMSIADRNRSPIQLHLASTLLLFCFVFVLFVSLLLQHQTNIFFGGFFVTHSILFSLCNKHTRTQYKRPKLSFRWNNRMKAPDVFIVFFRTIPLNWTRCWQTLRKS